MSNVINILILIASLEGLTILCVLRKRARERSQRRVSQLEQAAIYLRHHAEQLERFLDDPGAPIELKAVLIGFSDAMADRKIAKEVAKFFYNNQGETVAMSPEAKALVETVDRLRSTNPELATAFIGAIGSAIAAGFLRWPEAAQFIDLLIARVVADPQREVAAAAEGARMRTGFRFGMRPTAAAAA